MPECGFVAVFIAELYCRCLEIFWIHCIMVKPTFFARPIFLHVNLWVCDFLLYAIFLMFGNFLIFHIKNVTSCIKYTCVCSPVNYFRIDKTKILCLIKKWFKNRFFNLDCSLFIFWIKGKHAMMSSITNLAILNMA